MPPSQLKRLKSSLREQGVLGPQQSKKQKKETARGGYNSDKRLAKKAALDGIREKFNPFEFMLPSRRPKWDSTTLEGNRDKKTPRRPGLKASLEEEAFARGYQEERDNRHKVGGIIDKRFGENDPTMTPEAKMLERYTRTQLKGRGKASAFDLEDDDETGELTHMGKSLSFDRPAIRDDFEEDDLRLSDGEVDPSRRKRRHSEVESGMEDEEEEANEEDVPQKKKSKQEVMKELIAKSKLHKYERQAAKDDDDDLREELDNDMPNIHALLRGIAPKPAPKPIAAVPGMNPDRLALLHNTEKAKIEKDYDIRLRQLAQDQRSKPTEKSKTEEQIVEERARKLQDLEAKRMRRMKGAESSEDEAAGNDSEVEVEDEDYGLGAGITSKPALNEMDLVDEVEDDEDDDPIAGISSQHTTGGAEYDDEDNFLIDDDLVGSGSDFDPDTVAFEQGLDDDEFVKGILSKEEADLPEFLTGANGPVQEVEDLTENGINGDLAFNFACPQSHEELLQVLRNVVILDLPTAVQRIRTIHSPKLKSENKVKLGNFAVSLVDHVSYLANQEKQAPFAVLERVVRHIHSLAKTYAVEIANNFRHHFEDMRRLRPLAPSHGDLVLLTAVGTIFPTSDHFHQVVTPAILSMARYLGLKVPQTLSDYVTGLYLCTLCVQYQQLSKRYVPEVTSFIENTLCVLAPKKLAKLPGNFPYHEPKTSMRVTDRIESSRKLNFEDCARQESSEAKQAELKVAVIEASVKLLDKAADTWTGLSAFTEVFEPVLVIMKHLSSKGCRTKLPDSTNSTISASIKKLELQLQTAQIKRRPLELHHHRPLAIKMAIPKFEESFNPDRHYDPDPERTEAAKLKKEYKREHKGAVRALRKDARISANKQLRDKREKDEKYEKNQKRLMAMIQGEEGREQKAYAREKEWRKKGKK